jgi:membrane protein insertase Oxa1/YidC/SpoIIIJ
MRLARRRSTAEPTPGEGVLRFTPLLFGAWALSLPLAVGVYYATSSVLRLGVYWTLNRQLSA